MKQFLIGPCIKLLSWSYCLIQRTFEIYIKLQVYLKMEDDTTQKLLTTDSNEIPLPAILNLQNQIKMVANFLREYTVSMCANILLKWSNLNDILLYHSKGLFLVWIFILSSYLHLYKFRCLIGFVDL